MSFHVFARTFRVLSFKRIINTFELVNNLLIGNPIISHPMSRKYFQKKLRNQAIFAII